ncbi:MAG: LacI family transcriptional regulator [Bifidobacteriaceae bacterium]|jgi:LacI family transcriptional regulator|nr:LacI family transcriptional regulator [Bifidobacteriaceae bacterium]
MSPASRATLSSVARRAGASLATASKVLNARPGVAPATRARVRQAIDELGYSPSTPRADAPGQAVIRVTAIFRSLDATMYCAHILESLLQEAAARGVQVIVRLLDPPPAPDRQRMNRWARSLLGGGCQGAVFITSNLTREQIEACERVGLPLASVDCDALADAGVASISADNFGGGQLAIRHLLGLGHRRIALVIGRQNSTFARERRRGMAAAFAEAGLELDEELVVEAGFTPQDGLAAARRLLSLDRPPTAIAANCDGCALGVMAAASERGLAVPAELSVIGFDGTMHAAWSTPGLTTVVQPLDEIGRLTVQVILSLIRGEALAVRQLRLATRLVERESTGPPRIESL